MSIMSCLECCQSVQYMIRPCCCHVLSPWFGKLGLIFGTLLSTGHTSFTQQLQLFVLLSVLLSLVNIV